MYPVAAVPRKILHVVQSLGTGGLENGVVNLANGIDRRRFSLDILCLRYVGELRSRLASRTGVFFDDVTAESIVRSVLAVRRYCSNGRYDVVHTHGWATLLPGYLGAKLAGTTHIVNGEHGTFFADTAVRRLAQRVLFRLVDANCTVSESLRDEMQELFHHPASRVYPITNGVDVDRFRPDNVTRLTIRDALGIAPEDVLFGTVGRLVAVKDYRTLLNGFCRFSAGFDRARLALVGDGPELEELRILATRHGKAEKVVFLGNRDDVPSLMNAMDVFCLTSLREGLSNTLLEAHASGLPVLATRTGGNGEVVDCGKTGFLFAVGDEAGLSDLMHTMATETSLREEFGSAARQRAIAEFSIGRMVRDYEHLYEHLVRG